MIDSPRRICECCKKKEASFVMRCLDCEDKFVCSKECGGKLQNRYFTRVRCFDKL